MEKLEFEIIEMPLQFTAGKEVREDDSFKVIARDDNFKALSVMKKSYEPLFNRQFELIAEKMAEVSGFELLNFKEFKEGRIILANLKNTSDVEELFGKKIEDYMILGSSHDGSYPFFIGTAMVNVWCQNQFSKISRIAKVRHTSTSEVKRDALMADLEVYFKQRESILEHFTRFQKVEIPEELRKEAIHRIFEIKKEDMLEGKISTRKLNQMELVRGAYAIEAAEYGNTAYALFNAFTRYTTHTLESKDKVFGNFHGVPGWLNEKAYKVAEEIVEGNFIYK